MFSWGRPEGCGILAEGNETVAPYLRNGSGLPHGEPGKVQRKRRVGKRQPKPEEQSNRTLPQQPVSAEYVRAKIVGDGDVPPVIVNSIVAISNSQKCAEAFAKYFLFTPSHVVKSHGFKLSGRATLNQNNAAQLLGWTQSQVDSTKAAFDRDKKWISPTYTADSSYPRIPTVVFNASVINIPEFGGPRDIVTHAFIHLAGVKGQQTGDGHDLSFFKPYEEILNACR